MKTLVLIFGMLLLTLASFGQFAEVVAAQRGDAIGKRRFTIDIVYADTIIPFTDTIYKVLEIERLKLQPKVVRALNFMERRGWTFMFEYPSSYDAVISEEHYLFRKKE